MAEQVYLQFVTQNNYLSADWRHIWCWCLSYMKLLQWTSVRTRHCTSFLPVLKMQQLALNSASCGTTLRSSSHCILLHVLRPQIFVLPHPWRGGGRECEGSTSCQDAPMGAPPLCRSLNLNNQPCCFPLCLWFSRTQRHWLALIWQNGKTKEKKDHSTWRSPMAPLTLSTRFSIHRYCVTTCWTGAELNENMQLFTL